MRIRIVFLLPLVLCLLFTTAALAGPNMRDGLWQITTKMEMPGMPGQMPPMTSRHCLTSEDIVPQKPEPGQQCKITSTRISGNTVSWVMQCSTNEGTMTSNGEVTYKGDTFDGVIKTTMKQSSQAPMNMTMHISGRRVGDCSK
ncbi:MAG: DUF3617 family protein [Deltaproteobacteria bacterium]|nr:DUF3617 family protein [Deltaproteobacteria bacterium]MBW2071874.1 DUF3617 family protein [Deltaproteobacteria bacterium]